MQKRFLRVFSWLGLIWLSTGLAFAQNPVTNLLTKATAEFRTDWVPLLCVLIGGGALAAWGFGSHKGQSMVIVAVVVICCLIGLASLITWASA